MKSDQELRFDELDAAMASDEVRSKNILQEGISIECPEGKYVGTWSGWYVTFMVNGITINALTTIAIKTPSPAEVTVQSDGSMSVKILEVRPLGD